MPVLMNILFVAILAVTFWILNWKAKWPTNWPTVGGKPLALWILDVGLVLIFIFWFLQICGLGKSGGLPLK